jgi:riboflavin kinase/FMN adenylyltransferase
MALIAETGIEVCFLVPFTREFSKIEARDFVADILVKKLRVRDVVLGFNARFGRGREGDAAMMAGFSREFGFGFRAMPPVEAGGGLVSSSRIREAIRDGRLDEAQECLGRPYSFVVPVVHGDGRGKGLGYPTANLDVGGLEMPPEGVYPVLVRTIEGADGPVGLKAVETFEAGHPGPWLLGALNYGRRPTFKHDDKFCAEVFILDFQGDLYGRAMEAVLYPRIRGEMAFPDAGALKRQIAEDILKIRRFFDSTKNCFTSLVK